MLSLELVHHTGLLCLPQGLVTLPAVNVPVEHNPESVLRVHMRLKQYAVHHCVMTSEAV